MTSHDIQETKIEKKAKRKGNRHDASLNNCFRTTAFLSLSLSLLHAHTYNAES